MLVNWLACIYGLNARLQERPEVICFTTPRGMLSGRNWFEEEGGNSSVERSLKCALATICREGRRIKHMRLNIWTVSKYTLCSAWEEGEGGHQSSWETLRPCILQILSLKIHEVHFVAMWIICFPVSREKCIVTYQALKPAIRLNMWTLGLLEINKPVCIKHCSSMAIGS